MASARVQADAKDVLAGRALGERGVEWGGEVDAWLAVRAVGEAGMEGLHCCDFGRGLEPDVEEAAGFVP